MNIPPTYQVSPPITVLLHHAFAVCAGLLLTACGGGGESTSTPPPPAATYQIRSVQDEGVIVNPILETVTHGSRVTFTINMKPLYSLIYARGCEGTLNGNTFVTAPLTAPCTLTVTSRHPSANFGVLKLRPNVLFHDEFATTPVTLEVVTDGTPGVRLFAEYAQNTFNPGLGFSNTRVALRDDGSGGDRFADDGIHTAVFSTGLTPVLRYHNRTVDRLPIYIITENAAGERVGATTKGMSNVQLGVVHRSHAVPVTQLAPDVFATSHAVNVVLPNLPDAEAVRKVYAYYPDAFEGFAKFYIGATAAQAYAGGGALRSAVQGINQPMYDNSRVFGSAGALTSSTHYFVDMVAETFNHELAHTWGFHLNNPALELTNGYGFHAGLATITGPMSQLSNQQLVEQQDGSFRVVQDNSNPQIGNLQFTDLDLYLMGLLPPSSVAPSYFLSDKTYLNGSLQTPLSRDRVRRVTIDDVIGVYGPRIPSAEQSPKTFRMVFMALSETPASAAEMAFVNQVAIYQEGDFDGGPLGVIGPGLMQPPRSFKSATRGLATLITRLPPPR